MMMLFISFLVLGAVVTASNASNATCAALQSIPDSIFFSQSPDYNASVSSYPFVQLRLQPSCVFRPRTAQDVSRAVKILRKRCDAKFAIKCGGHNANVGFNNIEDGVTVDMQKMNSVNVADGVVKVGGGALWQDVYDAIEPHNLTVLGGRLGVVGVGGFLTGGGISYFSPERGWACDSVVNFQIVLANGDIVDANATSRPDLFTALKGGQSNFGIVTRFDLKSYPGRAMWGGRIVFAPEATKPLLSAFTDFKNPKNYDPYAAGWLTFRYNATTKLVNPASVLWYTRPELQPGVLAQMTQATPQVMNGMQIGSVAEFARNSSRGVQTFNSRAIWATSSFRISPTIVHRIYDLWERTVPKICETYAFANTAAELTFQALPPLPAKGNPNSLGFAPNSSPEKDLVFLQFMFFFGDVGATEGLNTALNDLIRMVDKVAEEEGVKEDYLYLNFAAWFQDPFAGYGREQVRKLRHVAKKYDPEGFFQKQVYRGFKLF